MYNEAQDYGAEGSVNARARNAKLFGRAPATVGSIVTAWSKVFRTSDGNDKDVQRKALSCGTPRNREVK